MFNRASSVERAENSQLTEAIEDVKREKVYPEPWSTFPPQMQTCIRDIIDLDLISISSESSTEWLIFDQNDQTHNSYDIPTEAEKPKERSQSPPDDIFFPNLMSSYEYSTITNITDVTDTISTVSDADEDSRLEEDSHLEGNYSDESSSDDDDSIKSSGSDSSWSTTDELDSLSDVESESSEQKPAQKPEVTGSTMTEEQKLMYRIWMTRKFWDDATNP